MQQRNFVYRILFSLSLLCLLILAGCPASKSEDSNTLPLETNTKVDAKDTGAFKDLDPWILKTTDPNANRANHGIYLSSGQVGITVGANGGADKNSVCFRAGGYKSENLESTPTYLKDLNFPEPKVNETYEQTLDMKNGVLTTKIGNKTAQIFVSAASPDLILWKNNEKWGTIAATEKAIDGYPLPKTFEEALAAHGKIWQERWQGKDIIIEGDPEAQQLVHKLMFELLQSAPKPNFDPQYKTFASIAPEALSGDFYKGHIFWDAEVWMFPALLAQHPEAAKQMLEYRFAHLEQAQEQAKKQNCSGADFPWESAATGKETVGGDFSKGRHVTGGVAWAAWQYWLVMQDKKWLETRGYPLISNIADYFSTRAKQNAMGGFDINGVTGPDELHPNVNNNTYTNAMAKNALESATEAAKILEKTPNPLWKVVAEKLVLPKNKDGVYLRCEGDDGKPGTKQADGELLLWPAKLAGADAKTFDFHKSRPIKNGPAMTDSIHALISARLGRATEAEEEFRQSYRPFVRGPFLLFSEKRSLDRCVFTTGCGGVLQSILYGFGGIDNPKLPVTLPKSWKKLEIQGVVKAGKRYNITLTPQGKTETVAPQPPSLRVSTR